MTCEDFQRNSSTYLDDCLPASLRQACDEHLAECPVCRAEHAHTRAVVRQLAMLSHSAAPSDLAAVINSRLQTERAALAQMNSETPVGFSERLRQWSFSRLMPYTVGAFASLILFFGVLGALRSNFVALHGMEHESVGVSVIDANSFASSQTHSGYDVTQPVTPEAYVASREPFTITSPSLNPNGQLASLQWNEPPDDDTTGEDDMVVLADVFSDGHATLAEVISPPRDPRMLDEVEDALRRGAVFVPASLDQRPRTMRVVFMFQKMDVRESSF